MSSAISQLSCFSSIISNRRLQLQTRSYSRPNRFRPGKFWVLNVMSNDGRGTNVPNLENKTTPNYVEDASQSHNRSSVKSRPLTEDSVVGASNGYMEHQKAAKIHDFCFGIPFGALVLSGGLVGFTFTRNPVTLRTGVLYGGALLALSFVSLKVWRKGKSSLPFILGQAGQKPHVLSITLLWKNFEAYLLTGKLFPTGFNAVISAAMILFYSYVVLSGGNPPPKKLRHSTSVEAS
ncbi:hypothetical protein OROGR_016862 [Orobanche gracilis]